MWGCRVGASLDMEIDMSMFSRPPRQEYIFFVQCENYVKIARSMGPNYYLKDMSYHNPFELKILKKLCGNIKNEQSLKRKFSGYRHNGAWYRYEGKLKEFIEGTLI